MQGKKGGEMRTEKPAVKFELEYRADVLLRNRPDGRFGIKGEVKNKIVVSKDGSICLDFQSDIFPCPPLAVREEEQAARFLRTLGNFVEKYVAHHGIASPPYLDYVVNFFRLFYADGSCIKFVLDDMEEGSRDALKDILNVFLEKYERRSDIGKSIPQGICRYVQISTDKNDKEYSYLWDGEEISIGEKVVVPFGEENERVRGKVVSVEYYREKDVPYPLGRMKKIICLENS